MSNHHFLGSDNEPASEGHGPGIDFGPDDLARHLIADLLSSVVSTPHKYVEPLVQRWGLGCAKVTLDTAGELAGVTRERMRQIEKLVAKEAESAHTPLPEFLREGLRNPLQMRRMWPAWELDAWERLFALHGLKMQPGIRESLKTVDERIQKNAELRRIIRDSANQLGFINLRLLEEAIGSVNGDEPLDWDGILAGVFPRVTVSFPWGWVAKGAKPNQSEGFVIRQLSISCPLNVHTAWEGVVIGARSRSHRYMLPPKADFLRLLRASKYFSVEGEQIADSKFDISAPEGVVAWAVGYIRSQAGGVTELTQFLSAGAAKDHKPSTLQQYARMRPEFRCQANLVWLAGAEPDESQKEALSLLVEATETDSRIEFVAAEEGAFTLRGRVGGAFLRTGAWPLPNSVLDLLGDKKRSVRCCEDFDSEAVAVIRMGTWQGFSSLRNHLFLEHADVVGESLGSSVAFYVTPDNVQVLLNNP